MWTLSDFLQKLVPRGKILSPAGFVTQLLVNFGREERQPAGCLRGHSGQPLFRRKLRVKKQDPEAVPDIFAVQPPFPD